MFFPTLLNAKKKGVVLQRLLQASTLQASGKALASFPLYKINVNYLSHPRLFLLSNQQLNSLPQLQTLEEGCQLTCQCQEVLGLLILALVLIQTGPHSLHLRLMLAFLQPGFPNHRRCLIQQPLRAYHTDRQCLPYPS